MGVIDANWRLQLCGTPSSAKPKVEAEEYVLQGRCESVLLN